MIATYYDAPTDEGSGLMRGADEQPGSMFSYISPEERVPADHPLRAVRRITDSPTLRKVVLARDVYASADRPIDPRVLLRRLAARFPGTRPYRSLAGRCQTVMAILPRACPALRWSMASAASASG